MDMAECGGACLPAQHKESSLAPGKGSTEYKECANCGVNDTPLWRKYNDHDLCNACGIYFRVNGFHRPFLPNMRKLLSSARKMGLACVNCGTKITSMWRRTPEGESICNACGLYFRLNGVKRPVSMRKDWIRKRQRKTQQISGIMRLANQSSVSSLLSSGPECSPNSPISSQFEASPAACFSNAYPTGPSMEQEQMYKSVDYVQYYTPDYSSGPVQFQTPSQMAPLHEPVPHELTHQLTQPGQSAVSSISSISYLHGLQPYPSQLSEQYMHSFGDIKSHH